MKTIAILLTLAACGTDGPPDATDDPRTVSCNTFRNDTYERIPQQTCLFDVSGIDIAESPFEDNVLTIDGYCCPGCLGCSSSDIGSATLVEGTMYKTAAIMWGEDAESEGVAVVAGDIGNLPIPEWSCIWQRCTRVE